MGSSKKAEAARVLVVEDHAVVRDGFVSLINKEDDLEVCAEAEDAPGAMRAIQEAKPDLVVLDLILKGTDGIDVIKSIRAQDSSLPVLIISMQDEEVYAERAFRAGANGYIMKDRATDEFLEAIRGVLAGELYLSRKMNVRLLHKLLDGTTPSADPGSAVDVLTDRELNIFQLIGAGVPTREIADQLGISRKTVETHRENIKHKLDLKNATALVQFASTWVQSHPG